MLGLRCTQHLKASSAAVAALSSMDSSVLSILRRLPWHIRKKLKALPADIRATLLTAEYEGSTERSRASTAAAITLPQPLQDSAEYYFRNGGKLLRPTVSMLMSDACNAETRRSTGIDRTEQQFYDQYRIAMITEMIHTASLVHDDVLDHADVRRGHPTVNATWGNRQAVLTGDYILARATAILAAIGQPRVVAVMSSIVEDIVKGEVMQLLLPVEHDPTKRFRDYMQKSFYKTASMFAHSCKSAAILAGSSTKTEEAAFEFGRHLGMAFQLTDDALDYMSTSSELGKPVNSDLQQGLATAPVLFAAQAHPELNSLISRRFSEPGDAERAHDIVLASRAFEQTHQLANEHCEKAKTMLTTVFASSPNVELLTDLAMLMHNRRS